MEEGKFPPLLNSAPLTGVLWTGRGLQPETQLGIRSEIAPSLRFIDYTIGFRLQAQQTIERCLHLHAGQANSDPNLDLSLPGVWPLKP